MSCVVVSDRPLDDDALGGRSLEAGMQWDGMEMEQICLLLEERSEWMSEKGAAFRGFFLLGS
jgi:hypothetical protein